MRCVALNGNSPMTCREIADELRLPIQAVSQAMLSYNNIKPHKYFRRLKPKAGKAYRYKLTKKGTEYLIKYAYRFYDGFDLSLEHPEKVKQMPKRQRVLEQRRNDSVQRHKILKETGIYRSRPKPTLRELLDIAPVDLTEYMGITKKGALEMGIMAIEVAIEVK